MKTCTNCSIEVRKDNKTGLCEKCRVKKWHMEHKERVNEMKNKWLRNNPEKRKEVVKKDNNIVGKERKERWYDNFWFNGRRKILLKTHPYCCRCGKTKMLRVHHKDGKGLNSKTQNNNWNNLIVLCFPCHMEVHRKKIKKYYVGK